MSGQVFTLPDLGEGLTEAEIVEWQVTVGDTVAIDQHVVVVETAKATVEVPCPYAGQVLRLHGSEGQSLQVGQPLITVGEQDAPAEAGHERYREEEQAGSRSGAVLIGYGTGSGGGRRRRRAVRPARHTGSPVRQAAGQVGHAVDGPVGHADGQAVRVISPLVRRLAADHHVDLHTLTPSRPDGIIRRADVESALRTDSLHRPDTATAANVGGSGHDTPPSGCPVGGIAPARTPLKGIRKAIADKLTTSRREIPDATTWVDVDATELVAAREALRAATPEAGIGILALMARITVAGLARFPELNASVDLEAEEIVQHGHLNLGFAVQSPRGLVVPVVRDAHTLTTAELARELHTLTGAAREGLLTPAQLTGGTFTLNNYGVFGVDGSTPIINHPEAAMLGVGRIVDRPWAHRGELSLRKVTQLSLTFDHRVCDGGTAGGYLRFVADCVENPAVLLGAL